MPVDGMQRRFGTDCCSVERGAAVDGGVAWSCIEIFEQERRHLFIITTTTTTTSSLPSTLSPLLVRLFESGVVPLRRRIAD